ncbi:MAG: nucleoside triphosphate pyrophosphohydrolase [Actinomycetota bacterium]|nr:nucleoside triphosphate pyrophosphohydrolase [Actinomycetota bacterium]
MGSTDRLVLVATSPRLPAGLLSWSGWQAVRAGPLYAAAQGHRQVPYLAEAGIPVEVLMASGPAELASSFRERAAGGTAVWLAGDDGDRAFVRALGELVTAEATGGRTPAEIEVVYGSYDPPGARLLDVVATMDRLRSPGGCPWDAEQTHDSLAKYLLEEAYEAYETIEEADLAGLREELGDVLLQVVFHARLAQEQAGDDRWDIDDVAAGLVDKLVRRHPHVFADRQVAGAAEVSANWDSIKAAEKARSSVTDGVPMGQPALTLAATLQRRGLRAGLPPELLGPGQGAGTPAQAVAAAAAAVDGPRPEEALGQLLFAAVALARSVDVDPEAALRGSSRRFRDRLAATEAGVRAAVGEPALATAAAWRDLWAAAGRQRESDEPAGRER